MVNTDLAEFQVHKDGFRLIHYCANWKRTNNRKRTKIEIRSFYVVVGVSEFKTSKKVYSHIWGVAAVFL